MTTLRLSCYIDMNGHGKTLADLREFLRLADLLNLPETTSLSGDLSVGFDIPVGNIEPISCGDCPPGEIHNDILINTHTHEA